MKQRIKTRQQINREIGYLENLDMSFQFTTDTGSPRVQAFLDRKHIENRAAIRALLWVLKEVKDIGE